MVVCVCGKLKSTYSPWRIFLLPREGGGGAQKTDEAEAPGGTVRFLLRLCLRLLLDESDSAGASARKLVAAVPSVMGTPLMPPSPPMAVLVAPAGVDRVCVRGVEADMFSESEVKALCREPVT